MTPTTGAILRRITEADLSAASRKLTTIILDGIAWKDGHNGHERGTAAFTLAHLAEKMGMSRQHLTALLAELAASVLELVRWKPNGKFAPWLFCFGGNEDEAMPPDVVSASGDTSLSKQSKNKTIFAGRIEIAEIGNVYTPWADLIKAAKSSLACWNVDTQAIWDGFVAFNKARGNAAVRAEFLLGFMRKCRTRSPSERSALKPERTQPCPIDPKSSELHDQIRAAPSINRQFHASDLCRLIGQTEYDARVRDLVQQFGCPKFTAVLAVH